MSIVILVLATILFFIFTVLPTIKYRFIYALLAFAVMIGMTSVIVLNDSYEFGMKVETTKTTRPLVSSTTEQLDTLLYQQLGTGSERVYLYKTDVAQKKPQATKTADTTVKYHYTTKTPTVTITEERYVYQNKWSKFFFSILHNDKRLKHRTYDFAINQNWYVLSTKQAQRLKQVFSQNKERIQQATTKLVQERFAKRLQAEPTMSTAKQAALLKELQQEVLQQTVADLIKQTLK